MPIRPAGFAPGLIAAKPEKPCDGAVFGAFYSLLKKERNVPSGGVRKGLLAAGASCRACLACALALCTPNGRIAWIGNAAQSANSPNQAQPTWRNQAARKDRPHPAFAAARTPQAYADFATGLIAAKPEKPCDGGVFGAFYSLLKKERKQADTPALPFTGPRLRAHGQPSIGPLPGFHGPAAVADLGAAARRPKDRKLQGKSPVALPVSFCALSSLPL